jgi:uncharacterized protein (TIGR00255 family)
MLTAPVRLPDGVDEAGIAALLDAARQKFDYILLDAPAGLDAGFRLAACAADRAIVVATNDASSLRDAQRVVGELNRIKQVHLVVNRVQPKLLRRLRTTIEELVGQNVDETRLLTEVAVMADRSAIAEETVRLHAHIAQLRECMEKTEPIGRRIDFLVQELNREVNTISSKSQDVPITQLAVSMKAEIEKLREQLQNIE